MNEQALKDRIALLEDKLHEAEQVMDQSYWSLIPTSHRLVSLSARAKQVADNLHVMVCNIRLVLR
jgi:hypothetical protein